MTIKAMVVGVMGETEVIDIPPGQFQQAFREHCGAQYFDHLQLAPDLDIWVDDEGLLRDTVINWAMTDLRAHFWEQQGLTVPPDYPPLAGKALITGGADDEGETLSISDETVLLLEGWFKTWRDS